MAPDERLACRRKHRVVQRALGFVLDFHRVHPVRTVKGGFIIDILLEVLKGERRKNAARTPKLFKRVLEVSIAPPTLPATARPFW